MLIYAMPGNVSHVFNTSVTTGEVLRLAEMTNNDINAWSAYGTVATSPGDMWRQQFDDLSNTESCPTQNLHSNYFGPTVVSAHQNLDIFPKSTSTGNVQPQPPKSSASFQQPYEGLAFNVKLERSSPILSNDYSQWSPNRCHGSLAEFANAGNMLKDPSSQIAFESEMALYNLAVPSSEPQSLYSSEASSIPGGYSSGYSPLSTSRNFLPLPNINLSNNHEASEKIDWWSDTLATDETPSENACRLPYCSDGLLPRYLEGEAHQLSDGVWNMGTIDKGIWTSSFIATSTTLPEAVTFKVPSVSMASSSSESIQRHMSARSDSSSATSTDEDLSDFSEESLRSESLYDVEPSQHVHLPRPLLPAIPKPPREVECSRRLLPNSIPATQRVLPILPSNDFASSTTSGLDSPKVGEFPNVSQGKRKMPKLTSTMSKRLAPKPSQSSTKEVAVHHRDTNDDFLVKCRLAGMTYKEIRKQGKFAEAESTLRGRFRVLTKHKSARVRKPEWEENDIRLLKKAVHKLTTTSDLSRGKIPWKQVAEYIANNGGSYHFGNATCHKRWDELQS